MPAIRHWALCSPGLNENTRNHEMGQRIPRKYDNDLL